MNSFKFNKITEILTFSDSFLWGGYHMVSTIIAVYLAQKIDADPLKVISFGYAVYLLSRSLFQIPIAQYLDRKKGYADESIAIFISAIVISIGIFSYRFVNTDWHLYLIQLIIGLGVAINMPAWRKTFARYLDKGHEGVEYSIYDIINNISIAILIAAGGLFISETMNFDLFFTIAAIIVLVGGFIALLLLRDKNILDE